MRPLLRNSVRLDHYARTLDTESDSRGGTSETYTLTQTVTASIYPAESSESSEEYGKVDGSVFTASIEAEEPLNVGDKLIGTGSEAYLIVSVKNYTLSKQADLWRL